MYDVNYFIEKFEAIPEDEWTTCTQQNEQGQRCAYGHCMPISEKGSGRMHRSYGDETREGVALNKIFLILYPNEIWAPIAQINNGSERGYQQPTPKQRILAALCDIKKMQEVASADIIINAALKSEPEEKVVNQAQN